MVELVERELVEPYLDLGRVDLGGVDALVGEVVPGADQAADGGVVGEVVNEHDRDGGAADPILRAAAVEADHGSAQQIAREVRLALEDRADTHLLERGLAQTGSGVRLVRRQPQAPAMVLAKRGPQQLHRGLGVEPCVLDEVAPRTARISPGARYGSPTTGSASATSNALRSMGRVTPAARNLAKHLIHSRRHLSGAYRSRLSHCLTGNYWLRCTTMVVSPFEAPGEFLTVGPVLGCSASRRRPCTGASPVATLSTICSA